MNENTSHQPMRKNPTWMTCWEELFINHTTCELLHLRDMIFSAYFNYDLFRLTDLNMSCKLEELVDTIVIDVGE